jgi:uncharacterized protein
MAYRNGFGDRAWAWRCDERSGTHLTASGETVKFSLQTGEGVNLVRACTATEIRVGERLITTSAILTADRLVLDWPPRTAAALTGEHLREVLALGPELILLGTGERQEFPEAGVLRVALEQRVAVEVMDTRAACRTYNVLLQEGRRVAAAILMASKS